MAKNTGNGYRRGAVDKRSQTCPNPLRNEPIALRGKTFWFTHISTLGSCT